MLCADSLDKISGIDCERSGAPGGNLNQDYTYDARGRLIFDSFEPSNNFGAEALRSYYDLEAWNSPTANGIGVRTNLQRTNNDSLSLREVPVVAGFARVTNEVIRSQGRGVYLSGKALGAAKVSLSLDGRNVTSVSFNGATDNTGNWSTTQFLTPGDHLLQATATHPSGWQTAVESSSFRVAARPESVTSTYDDMGNLSHRVWSNGRDQTLKWDARGRLVEVTEANSFTWTAVYDGFNRRVRTIYTVEGDSPVQLDSKFDPEVEFLELAINGGAYNSWKVYGPDLSGSYGGLQGVGGLEAVDSAGVTRGIVNDWFGNAAGWVDAPGAAMTWSSARFLAWGTAPGAGMSRQEGNKPLHELLGYRGLTIDPPGYIHQGMRDYDLEGGRWISPDPLGHAGSLSLYDYCDSDPVNVFDPDGRFGKLVASNPGYPGASAVLAGANDLWQGFKYQEGWEGMSGGRILSNVVNNSFSFAAQNLPIVSTAWGAAALSTGTDPFTGRSVSQSEAAFSIAFGAMPGFGSAGGKMVGRTALNSVEQQIVRSGGTPIAANIASIVTRAGSNSRFVGWFDEAAVLADMASSPIGTKVLDAAQSNLFRLEFSKSYYQQSYRAAVEPNVLGMAFRTKAKIYLPAVGSNANAAATAIHEGVHMLGVAGSRRAEALARLSEIMHRGGTIDRGAMRSILVEMNATGAYNNLPWRSKGKTPFFPGLEF